MSLQLWKYPLKISHRQQVNMPEAAAILTVQLQHDEPHMWALCDTESPLKPRTILMYGTGRDITDTDTEYIGTVIMRDGLLVWHYFEDTTP